MLKFSNSPIFFLPKINEGNLNQGKVYAYFKGKAQFVQKVTFEPVMDFKQNHCIMEVENITKAATFHSFFHLSYKNTQLLFL